ncbi:MAG: ParB/RepB/Spo0J family partition protein, partial [Enterovibrio sp.]
MALNSLKGLSELAKAAQGKKKGKEILTVPIDEVTSKVQVRKRFRNIEELAATMLTEGQQSPIIVSPKNKDGKFVIQKGERRWRACKHAGIETIDLIINDKIQNALDETAGELIENIQRDDLTPVEIAEALELFVRDGWKQKEIAERLGKNISFVSTHLSLLKLPDCVRELYDSEACADTETLNNLRLLFELNEERCGAVCAVALSEGISRKQSRELLNDAKRIKEIMEKASQADQNAAKKGLNQNGLHGETRVSLPEQMNAEQTPPAQGRSENRVHANEAKSQQSKAWRDAKPDSLIFAVNVNLGGELKRGVIMTDRVALTPSTVWVKMLGGEGEEKHVHVPVSDIEL